MYYTIATTQDYNGMMLVNFNKKGNKYVVELINKGKQEETRRTFDNIYGAINVYERIIEAFILGLYSYEERKSWLTSEEET